MESDTSTMEQSADTITLESDAQFMFDSEFYMNFPILEMAILWLSTVQTLRKLSSIPALYGMKCASELAMFWKQYAARSFMRH